MYLTELPFHLRGRVFRSVMPFGDFDPEGEALTEFKRENVSVIVLLAEEEEYLMRAGQDLKALYVKKGFDIIHLPIPDFSVPRKKDLKHAVDAALEKARSGLNIVIHCYAGIGRTGLFAACLAKRVFGLSGEEAIRWVRKYIPGAVEAREQRQMILRD